MGQRFQYILCSHSFVPLNQVASCPVFFFAFFAYFLAGVRIRTDGLPVVVWPADNTWLVLSFGGLMVFCAYSALCFSAFPELAGVPTNPSYLDLLWYHLYTSVTRLSRAWLPSGSPVWKFTSRVPRGEESALGFGCCCCDRIPRKTKGEKFVITHDFKGF